MYPLWLALLPLGLTAYGQRANNSQSLLWGPYRPNLYFGLRPRIPQSLLTGLMWFGTQNYQSINRVRHACDQMDELDSYSWTEYDAREGGVQVLKDSQNNVKLTTEFLKVAGGNHGGSWAARIKGEALDSELPSRNSFIFYFGLEGMGGLEMETGEDGSGLEGPITFSGFSPELDEFAIRVVESLDNNHVTHGRWIQDFQHRVGKTHFLGRPVPAGNMWQAKEVIMQNIISHANGIVANSKYQDATTGAPDPSFILQLTDDVHTNSNLYAVQKTFQGDFQFDIFFESGSAKQKLSTSTLDQGIPALVSSLNERFESTFPTSSNFETSNPTSLQVFSKVITANLMAGVGYFYGTSIVNKAFSYEWDEDDDTNAGDAKGEEKGARLTEPKALLTATPSRSFFPRGFYCVGTKGFIWRISALGISTSGNVEILKDWINLIDEDGWVAREQILGEEARSKVPPEFQTQVPSFANPPTLTMAVTAFIAKARTMNNGPTGEDLGMDMRMGSQLPFSDTGAMSGGSEYLESFDVAVSFLKSIYQPLKRHYDWFRRTQRGHIKQYSRKARSRTEAYRWRGRSEKHVLTSGMDDYPRGPPHAGELHLDLISWMAFFTRTMREMAGFVGEVDDEANFGAIEKAILMNIEDLHWNEEQQMYCDLDVNDEDESYHVCHKGYVSLFPFLLALLPSDSPHLDAVLDLLHDPTHLWSPYGIRSLSASHEEFGKGENYWKGPIWIQMNYLALGALYKTYTKEEGPYQDKARQIYTELRNNIVNNVFKEYNRTAYVWEQYDPTTGFGKRSHPFTGWTSLVTLILAEKYT